MATNWATMVEQEYGESDGEQTVMLLDVWGHPRLVLCMSLAEWQTHRAKLCGFEMEIVTPEALQREKDFQEVEEVAAELKKGGVPESLFFQETDWGLRIRFTPKQILGFADTIKRYMSAGAVTKSHRPT